MEKAKETKEQQFAKECPDLYKTFKTIQAEQLELFCRKCMDYGISNISAGTKLDNEEDIKFALQGIWFRTMDKMNRWKNLMFVRNEAPANESLVDTFQDITNYATIASIVSRGGWHE